MAVRRGQARDVPQPIPLRPATTPEGREQQLIADAVELAQRQLRDGTASAQVITHFLKMGSTREQLEQERLARENILLKAKAEAMESAKRVEELYGKALTAMRAYQGEPPLELEGLGDEDL
jgi:hypothetical protein